MIDGKSSELIKYSIEIENWFARVKINVLYTEKLLKDLIKF